MVGLVVTSKRARRNDFHGHSDGARKKKMRKLQLDACVLKAASKALSGWQAESK